MPTLTVCSPADGIEEKKRKMARNSSRLQRYLTDNLPGEQGPSEFCRTSAGRRGDLAWPGICLLSVCLDCGRLHRRRSDLPLSSPSSIDILSLSSPWCTSLAKCPALVRRLSSSLTFCGPWSLPSSASCSCQAFAIILAFCACPVSALFWYALPLYFVLCPPV